MNINGGAIEFFYSSPDDLLVQIAENDWESLEAICNALTLDIQLLKEQGKLDENESFSHWGNMC